MLALTVGTVALMTPATVNAAGQVLGGLNPGNEATGDGSVIVSGGDTGAVNKAEGKNSAVLGGTNNAAEGDFTTVVGGFKNTVLDCL